MPVTNLAHLDKWAQLLLDTGKRNNLVHFKDTKLSSAEILCPDPVALFAKCDGSTSFEVYDPGLDYSEEEPFSRESYLDVYGPKIKQNRQVLVYAHASSPWAVIKSIDKKARSILDETGVNVAYMAFGFIHWKERHDMKTELRAPVLLVPISIESNSALASYCIRPTDDEAIVNPTFSYLLQAEYNVQLPAYTDDDNLSSYLQGISQLIAPLGWTVSAECKLGIFSFLKINMYRDIKDNASIIARHDIVRMLLGQTTVPNGQDAATVSQRLPANDVLELHSVVDADSSQIQAIRMAKSGRSFVLQGPPGTGKSQTISNIIAECLYDGKKVLFVSEKLAALNVVYDKLRQAGLEEFCLELHSHKSHKKEVIDELCRTVRAERSQVSARADKEIEKKAAAQKHLDSYVRELHEIRPAMGMSLFQLYNAFASVRHAPDVDYVFPDVASWNESRFSSSCALLEQYVSYVPIIGRDYTRHAWYGCVRDSLRFEERRNLRQSLEICVKGLGECISLVKTFSQLYELHCCSYTDVARWQRAFALIAHGDAIVPVLLKKEVFQYEWRLLQQLRTLSLEIGRQKERLDGMFEEDVYHYDGKDMHNRLKKQFSSLFSRLISREYRELLMRLRLCSRSGKKFRYDEAVTWTSVLADYQRNCAAFDDCDRERAVDLGNAYRGLRSDWERLMSQYEELGKLFDEGLSFGDCAERDVASFAVERQTYDGYAHQLADFFERCGSAFDRLATCFDGTVFDMRALDMERVWEHLSACLAHEDALDDWIRFYALLCRLKKESVLPYVDCCIAQGLVESDIVPAYEKAFYHQFISAMLCSNPVLDSFTRIQQDKMVEVFKEKDLLQFEISKAQIRAALSAQRPSLDMIAAGSAVAVLLREGEKKRRQKSIRTLLAETGDVAQRIKPCFLMSPLSVSTFLDSATMFDTVIFDEASQIFPQDALGAIYRGRQLIVVGDSQQMPPSNFFTATVNVDEAQEAGDDVGDFESILDICSITLPQLRLNWHYRSHYEQLIAFSNHSFYDGSLVTFPSAAAAHEGCGVEYFFVSNGVFDRRSHTNSAEAAFVVDLIYRNIERYPERSLGVLAFSVSQQELIEQLLAQRRQVDPRYEEFFSRDKREAFFIKNLETVQGDERDTIIFSVAYGRDSQQKLLHNFGPLNRVGGERRLNVAVTRAKDSVQLVSSMHYGDIDVSKSSAEGVRLLRDYLAYGELGTGIAGQKQRRSAFDSGTGQEGVAQEVGEFLKSKGFEVDMQLGSSACKIDVAVKRHDGNGYALAIECDGELYRDAQNTRDRDRLRQTVLERMGWRYYRLWSTDWFKNMQSEKKRLLTRAMQAAYGELVDGGATDAGKAMEADLRFEEPLSEENGFPRYAEADIPAICRTYMDVRRNFQSIVRKILECEAPLAEYLLLRRIHFLLGGEVVSSVARQEFDRRMEGCEEAGILRRNGFLYLASQNTFQLRVPGVSRAIKYIAPEELAAGMYAILEQNRRLKKTALFHALVKLLGFSHVGSAMTRSLDAAFDLIADAVEQEGDIVSLSV